MNSLAIEKQQNIADTFWKSYDWLWNHPKCIVHFLLCDGISFSILATVQTES